ncbi:reverse transcriptase domain-containing protein [Tanacetum coccineum]
MASLPGIEPNDDYASSDDDPLYNEDIDYVDASHPDSELVSLEEVKDFDTEEEEIDIDILLTIKDDILREKLLNINLLIAKIEALKEHKIDSQYLASAVTSAMAAMFKQHQVTPTPASVKAAMFKQHQVTPTPASVKAVEESCVTCGGAHSYRLCPTTNGNTFSGYQDNIQGYVSAAAVNYNQGNTGYRPQNVANQIRPPIFAQPNVQNNQTRYNQGYNQNRGINQGNPNYQAPTYQAPIHQPQVVTTSDFSNYIKANDVVADGIFPTHDRGETMEGLLSTNFSVFGESSPMPLPFRQNAQMSGIEVDKAKVDVIAKLPHPTSPMIHLLKKDTPFTFSKDCIESFNILKKKLTEASILVAPDWDLPFEIMCDASDYAVGAVLGQHKTKHFQPIHYASKTMTDAQAHYTTTEKELLAVVYAFEKFWPYLVLSKTIVYTDHSALKYLLAKQDAKLRLLR